LFLRIFFSAHDVIQFFTIDLPPAGRSHRFTNL
jgi:hypothetical protein